MKMDIPRAVVVYTILLLMGILLIYQMVQQHDLYFINKAYFGLDYHDFYKASVLIREGESPYTIDRYVTPPLPAQLNIPLTYLPFSKVCLRFSLGSFFSIILALFLVHRTFNERNWKRDVEFILSCLVILLFSYPFYFLFDRGNIDGYVLLFLCAGVFSLKKNETIAGILFAISIALKAYPALVVIPLLGWHRRKTLISLAVTMLILFVLSPHLWLEFIRERVMTRTMLFSLGENASLANLFYWIDRVLNTAEDAPFMKTAVFFYLILLVVATLPYWLRRRNISDDRTMLCASVLAYIPFMISMPQCVFHYELVCVLAMIPMLSWVWQNNASPIPRTLVVILALGIGIGQFNAVVAHKLTNQINYQFVPAIGLFITVLCVTALQWMGVLAAQKSDKHDTLAT